VTSHEFIFRRHKIKHVVRLPAFRFSDVAPTHASNPALWPVNEDGRKVSDALNNDLRETRTLRIVTGYTSIEMLLKVVIEKCQSLEKVELVFGNEPTTRLRTDSVLKSVSLSDEAKEYWLKRGISPVHSYRLTQFIQMIDEGKITARFHYDKDDESRMLHAKIVETDNSIMSGSSNVSLEGWHKNRELNRRFDRKSNDPVEKRDVQIQREYIDWCVHKSPDNTEDFRALLLELLKVVSWEEALSRSIHALLGRDVQEFDSREDRERWQGLWPHQRIAVKQALAIIENQGGVVVADPTGSGKTLVGAWITHLALRQYLSRNPGNRGLYQTVLVPPQVKSDWRREIGSLGSNPQLLSHGKLSRSESNDFQRISAVRTSPILTIDEIHNFYNKTSNRSRRLSEFSPDGVALLTATPINKGYNDLITLLQHLFGPWADPETIKELNSLKRGIKNPNQEQRESSRARARELIQPFMVRRTRQELQAFVERFPDVYLGGPTKVRYPQYNVLEYDLASITEDEVEPIKASISELIGVALLPSELNLRRKDWQKGMDLQTLLEQRLRTISGLARHNFWKAFDSHYIRLHEHIYGSEKANLVARNLFHANNIDLRGKAEELPGMVQKLSQMKLPKISLDQEDNMAELPDWLRDEEAFQREVRNEIKRYQSIVKEANAVAMKRDVARVDLLTRLAGLTDMRILAFEESITTVNALAAQLRQRGINNVHLYSTSHASKDVLVKKAGEEFGRDSPSGSKIGLMNDLMNEGINLQGANVVIHLTLPTTIRQVEQRIGRIDRMNTLHDDIEVYYPKRDPVSAQMRDLLQSRHELVSSLIGSNIEPPEGWTEIGFDENDDSGNLSDVDDIRSLLQHVNLNDHGIRDAFHEVQQLVGKEGLITEHLHARMENVEAKIVCSVTVLKSKKPWAMFCYETRTGNSSSWCLVDGNRVGVSDTKGIQTNLGEIVHFLRSELPAEPMKLTRNSTKQLELYLSEVQRKEYYTLPKGQRNLIDFLHQSVKSWSKKSTSPNLQRLCEATHPSKVYEFDTSRLLSAWNQLLRDYLTRIDHSMNARDFVLANIPIDEELQILYDSLVRSKQFDSRVQAVILGIPEP
jgi:superfamily II DNA or RNA helicase